MQENLRKVRFNLNNQDLTLGDCGFDDPEGILRERTGYFHRFGDVECLPNDENVLKTVAIVEEEATGLVYEVAPHCIQFVNE